MKRCLIYIDDINIQNSIDLLEVARQVYGDDTYETIGVNFNCNSKASMGAFDKIVQVMHPEIKIYDPVAITEVMAELQIKNSFNSILIPATPFGRILAPRLAMRLKTGLVADVTAISRKKDKLEVIRPAFSGRIMAGITCMSDGPLMMSIRQGVFNYEGDKSKPTEIINYEPKNFKDGHINCLYKKEKEQTYDIRESDVLVSGGGGVIRSFHYLKQLADKLDGQVSASRKIVDKGLASRNIQVGQSGKTVSPKLYIALGINGAMQHVEGLKQVENIISVNINSSAPICSLSDIVVEGDAMTFIEKLVEKIEETS